MEEQVARLRQREWHGPAGERDAPGFANGGDGGFDGGGIDGGGFVTGEAEEHGAVGGMAVAGESERAVELGVYSGHAIEQAALGEAASEAAGGAHGAHGVRARRADADFVEIEEAGRHD